jgi:hypothetical protein
VHEARTRGLSERAGCALYPLGLGYALSVGRCAWPSSRTDSSSNDGTCALYGCVLPVDLLVASQIKKRSACTHEERLDVDHVVMAACRLGCDDLFERGYIAIDDNGRIIASVSIEIETAALRQAVARVEGRTCPAFTEATRDYFAWHWGHTFRGK